MKKQNDEKEEYTTMRVKKKLLFKLVELRGKLELNNADEVIDYLITKLETTKDETKQTKPKK